MRVQYNKKELFLPDFLIIGAAKSGTSSLCYWLSDHPNIFIPEPKEPNFFTFANYENLYKEKGELFEKINMYNYDFDSYLNLYNDDNSKILGDASTSYLEYSDNVINNLKRYYGESINSLKLFVILRNPIDRAFSHYLMFRRWNVEKRSFEESIIPGKKVINSVYENQIDYISGGYYYKKIKQYKDCFGDNLKIFLFNEIVDSSENIIKECFKILGMNHSYVPYNLNSKFNVGGVPKNVLFKKLINFKQQAVKSKKVLSTFISPRLLRSVRSKVDFYIKRHLVYKPELEVSTRKYLVNLYKEDIIKTQNLIGKDLTSWV